MRTPELPSKAKKLLSFLAFVFLVAAGPSSGSQEKKEQEKKEEKPAKITEEILVTAITPQELSVAGVNSLSREKIENLKALDLSEAVKYAPGVYITYGNKNEFTLKLRGIDSKRIALLVDGIPVYEPYFSSFDLKTVATEGVDFLQITKGPSSVLYGPNTMGGIVNVVTRRPSAEPSLLLQAGYGERATKSLSLNSSFQWNRLAFSGTALYQDSDGFYYADAGQRIPRTNSDYERLNLNAKFYYTPSSRTEIMLNAGVYKSAYGIPHALAFYKPRYWRFKNWDRYTLNAGGFTGLGENSTLRFRAFLVRYQNTLDGYKDQAMTVRQFESTFDNSVYGFFTLGDFFLSPSHSLKISLNHQRDTARTQDDVGRPWSEFAQGNFSAGLEDHFTFARNWKLVAGLSFDFLDKHTGKNTSRVNPLAGINFSPTDDLELHLSFARKSKFPSMRSLYSPSLGNPDLSSEVGRNWEFGFSWSQYVSLTGAVFMNGFRDMIDSIRLPDGSRRDVNIGRARINGFELQAQKSLGMVEATINYTYLDHANESDNRPLDALANQNLNFDVGFIPLKGVRLGAYGLWASSSSWYEATSGKVLDIPPYFSLDAVLSYQMQNLEVFLKVTNVFNHYFYTEPGYPWRGRHAEMGLKVAVL